MIAEGYQFFSINKDKNNSDLYLGVCVEKIMTSFAQKILGKNPNKKKKGDPVPDGKFVDQLKNINLNISQRQHFVEKAEKNHKNLTEEIKRSLTLLQQDHRRENSMADFLEGINFEDEPTTSTKSDTPKRVLSLTNPESKPLRRKVDPKAPRAEYDQRSLVHQNHLASEQKVANPSTR
jgi:hypothetical protein